MITFSFNDKDDLIFPGIYDICLNSYKVLPFISFGDSNSDSSRSFPWVMQCFYPRADNIRAMIINKFGNEDQHYNLVEIILYWPDSSGKEHKALYRKRCSDMETLTIIETVYNNTYDCFDGWEDCSNIQNK